MYAVTRSRETAGLYHTAAGRGLGRCQGLTGEGESHATAVERVYE